MALQASGARLFWKKRKLSCAKTEEGGEEAGRVENDNGSVEVKGEDRKGHG